MGISLKIPPQYLLEAVLVFAVLVYRLESKLIAKEQNLGQNCIRGSCLRGCLHQIACRVTAWKTGRAPTIYLVAAE